MRLTSLGPFSGASVFYFGRPNPQSVRCLGHTCGRRQLSNAHTFQCRNLQPRCCVGCVCLREHGLPPCRQWSVSPPLRPMLRKDSQMVYLSSIIFQRPLGATVYSEVYIWKLPSVVLSYISPSHKFLFACTPSHNIYL